MRGGTGVSVGFGVGVGVGVGRGTAVGLGVGVGVTVAVGVRGTVAVGSGVALGRGVTVGGIVGTGEVVGVATVVEPAGSVMGTGAGSDLPQATNRTAQKTAKPGRMAVDGMGRLYRTRPARLDVSTLAPVRGDRPTWPRGRREPTTLQRRIYQLATVSSR